MYKCRPIVRKWLLFVVVACACVWFVFLRSRPVFTAAYSRYAREVILPSSIQHNRIGTLTNILRSDKGLAHSYIKEGQTPLSIASHYNNTKATKVLLDYGADPNAYDMRLGVTPLCIAAMHDNVSMVSLLLSYKASPLYGSKYDGNTPLHYAVQNNSISIVKLLASAGAAINAQNKFGHTPLHIAANFGATRCVIYLLNEGADPHVKDLIGDTPYANARDPYIRRLLRNAQ